VIDPFRLFATVELIFLSILKLKKKENKEEKKRMVKCLSCQKEASYNYPGERSRLYCLDHKKPTMINVKKIRVGMKQKGNRAKSIKKPTYNTRGTQRVIPPSESFQTTQFYLYFLYRIFYLKDDPDGSLRHCLTKMTPSDEALWMEFLITSRELNNEEWNDIADHYLLRPMHFLIEGRRRPELTLERLIEVYS